MTRSTRRPIGPMHNWRNRSRSSSSLRWRPSTKSIGLRLSDMTRPPLADAERSHLPRTHPSVVADEVRDRCSTPHRIEDHATSSILRGSGVWIQDLIGSSVRFLPVRLFGFMTHLRSEIDFVGRQLILTPVIELVRLP